MGEPMADTISLMGVPSLCTLGEPYSTPGNWLIVLGSPSLFLSPTPLANSMGHIIHHCFCSSVLYVLHWSEDWLNSHNATDLYNSSFLAP